MKRLREIAFGAGCALCCALSGFAGNSAEGDFVKDDGLSDGSRWEIGVEAGSIGVGVDLGYRINKWARVRVGYQQMPHFTQTLQYNMEDEGAADGSFSEIQTFMKDLTGFEMDKSIDMVCTPSFRNFKVLADIYPFANNEREWLKRFRVSVGCLVGPGRVGQTVNAVEEMPSLVMAAAYNHLYDKVTAPDFIDKVIDEPLFDNDGSPIWLDPQTAITLQEKFLAYGRAGVNFGYLPDGTPYMVEPNRDGTIRANAFVNVFKPYAGVGYEGSLPFDRKFSLGMDLGAMFWGGSPRIEIVDGKVLNGLTNRPPKLERYMKLVGMAKVWPVATLRLSYSF